MFRPRAIEACRTFALSSLTACAADPSTNGDDSADASSSASAGDESDSASTSGEGSGAEATSTTGSGSTGAEGSSETGSTGGSGTGTATTGSEGTGSESGSEAGSTGSGETGSMGVCGDGVVDPGEVCDDGNRANRDGCPGSCRPLAGMVFIPAGTFMMGCSTDDDECVDDENPLHEVQLSAYEIDITEVTHPAYASCVESAGCNPPDEMWGDDGNQFYPVVGVTRTEADFYCEWVGKRLPTEAEWERAARGDDDTRIYPWGDTFEPSLCALVGHAERGLVASGDPAGDSPFGVKDLCGGVSEWVSDWYGLYEDSGPPWIDPGGPANGTYRITKGGSFDAMPTGARISRRNFDDPGSPGFSTVGLGFRCVHDP